MKLMSWLLTISNSEEPIIVLQLKSNGGNLANVLSWVISCLFAVRFVPFHWRLMRVFLLLGFGAVALKL